MIAINKRAFVTCLICLVVVPAFAGQPLARPGPLPLDSIYQLPIKLVDQTGNTFEWNTLRGKPRVISMFYTSCQFVCPLIIDAGKAIEKGLTPAQQKRLGIIVVSMDPKRDTVAALKRVFVERGLDAARWTLTSPKANDVRTIAGLLGIRYRQLSNGDFNHSTMLLLLDANGRVLTRTEKVGAVVDQEFLTAVRHATVVR